MKNSMDDKLRELEEMKKEDNLTIKELSQVIDNNIKIINNFTPENCEDILVKMFENYREVFALDENIAALNNLIDEANEEKDSIINKQSITIRDIYQELFTKIMIIYFISSYTLSLNSSDPLDFIKKYLIVALIGITTFDLNIKYFTSDYRKKRLKRTAAELDFTIESNKCTIKTLKKYRQLFQKEIDYERQKLTEIIPPINESENYEDYIKRIFPLAQNIEFISVDEKIKKREK